MAVKNANAKTWNLPVEWNGKRYSDPADVPEQPSPIEAPTLSSPVLGSSSATVAFSGGGGYATLIPQYSTDQSNWTSLISDTESPFNFSGLSPNTLYYFRALADGNVIYDSNVVSGATTVSGSWQRPSTNWEEAKIPLSLGFSYPRPDAETGSNARHKFAAPGKPFNITFVPIGGAHFGRFEIISRSGTADTSGAVIGDFLSESGDELVITSEYGTLSWTPSVSDNEKTYSFTVRYTDQNEDYIETTINGLVDASKFIYASPSASGVGDGSEGSPFTISQVFGTTSAAINSGKIVYFRGGVYSVPGHSDSSGNLRMDNNTKPQTWLAYPGESPIWDFSTSGVINTFSVSDLYVDGIRFRNNTAAPGRFMSINNVRSRNSWFRTTWENHSNGTGTNPGAIYFSGVDGQYMTVHDAVLTGTFCNFLQVYRWQRSVASWIRGVGLTINDAEASNHGIIYWKQHPYQVSTRLIDFGSTNYSGSNINSSCIGCGTSQGSEQVEICYSKLYHPVLNTGGNGHGVIRMGDGGDQPANNHWYYRNNFRGRILDVGAGGTYFNPFLLAKNVFEGYGPPTQRTGYTYTGNLLNQTGALDGTTSLTGAARTEHLGLIGAEYA